MKRYVLPFLVLFPTGKDLGFAIGFCICKYSVNCFVDYGLCRCTPIETLVIMYGRALCSTVLGNFLGVILCFADGMSAK